MRFRLVRDIIRPTGPPSVPQGAPSYLRVHTCSPQNPTEEQIGPCPSLHLEPLTPVDACVEQIRAT